MPAEPRRLLFVVTEDWYFCSHRLPLAIAAREAGYRVAVATRVASHGDRIRASGLELLPLRWLRRSSVNPWVELRALFELLALYRSWKPTLVHHVALKPVLYGSFAAGLARLPARINALAGLGYVFSSTRPFARAVRPLVRLGYRLALRSRRATTIVQNPDDARLLVRERLVEPSRLRVVRGSGVDLQRFRPPTSRSGDVVVILMSRMLWDKGVGEFVEAARQLRGANVAARFVLVGEPDPENPAAIGRQQLEQWRDEGVVDWNGSAEPDVALAQATIVCLPSYREGLPKVLLEAAACGLPMVASDVPGCREVVIAGRTGLVVPPRDPAALARAMQRLIADPDLRAEYGRHARALAESEFGVDRVVRQTLDIYEDQLACARS